MRRCERNRQRGIALVTTLLAVSLLLFIGALAAQQAVVSLLIGHRMREGAEAMIAAETAMSVIRFDLHREPGFARLAGAVGGEFPFAAASPPIQPLPDSFTVETRVRARDDDHLDILAIADGRNRARRILLATVERSEGPYVPSALYFAGGDASLSFTGNLGITGESTDSAPASAVGAATQAAAQLLDAELAAGGATVDGDVATASWNDLGNLVTRLRERAAPLPAPPREMAPGLWRSAGSVDVDDAGGSGIWLIDGDLGVENRLAFAGLLIVGGDVFFREGSEVVITGALVQVEPGRVLQSRGNTIIAFDAAALREADALDPSLLGRRAKLIGLRDEDA